jgi:Tfp pilus assembly protein PilV
MHLLSDCGQILIEAVISCLLMAVLMIAFAKLIELKKNNKPNLKNIQQKLEELNAANEPAK